MQWATTISETAAIMDPKLLPSLSFQIQSMSVGAVWLIADWVEAGCCASSI